MTTYRGRHGTQTYSLGRRLGGGGEGEVFDIEGQPDLVAKIYYDKKYSELSSVVPNPREYLRDKICCMLDSPVSGFTKNEKGQSVLTVAWPRDALFDGKGSFVGYVMPKVSSRYSIHTAYRPIEQPLLFKTYTWKSAITIAFNLVSAVSYLHARDIVIGDFNSNNIHIDEHGFVTLIDSDSFNVADRKNGAVVYKCMVGCQKYWRQSFRERISPSPRACSPRKATASPLQSTFSSWLWAIYIRSDAMEWISHARLHR